LGPGGIILIVLALIVLSLLATRQNRTLGLHQAVQYDDFFFTVEDASRLPAPAEPVRARPGEPGAGDADYLVRIKVENRAKRVPFQFSGQFFVFVDPAGNRPMIRPSAERSPSGDLSPPALYVLQAGESRSVDYVFSLPGDLKDLRLRVMTGGPVGDFLDWLLFGRKEFQLP
jgi:hypothetical protein